MVEAVDSFFSNLLGDTTNREFMLDLDEPGLPRKDMSHLEVAFTEEEIWAAVRA